MLVFCVSELNFSFVFFCGFAGVQPVRILFVYFAVTFPAQFALSRRKTVRTIYRATMFSRHTN